MTAADYDWSEQVALRDRIPAENRREAARREAVIAEWLDDAEDGQAKR